MSLLVIVIVLALTFDIINGFHDAANSIATIVSTGVLTPKYAVVWAAFFNFIAYLVFGLHVAHTVGKNIIHTEVVTLQVLMGALIAAIVWNMVTWWFGIPTSSSHTLIGGFIGAAVARAGFRSVFYSEVVKISAFIILAPIIGILVSVLFSVIVLNLGKRLAPSRMDKYFRKLQLLSSAAYSLGHGANDAQKVMGIIYVALIAANQLGVNDAIPFWVVLSCQFAMAIGTLIGGWRIVKTMGSKITKLKPFEGFCAETAGAITLFGTSILGIPVSTTHTITGAIIGAGSVKRMSAVRWGVTIPIVYAWVITIPVTAVLAALLYYIISFF